MLQTRIFLRLQKIKSKLRFSLFVDVLSQKSSWRTPGREICNSVFFFIFDVLWVGMWQELSDWMLKRESQKKRFWLSYSQLCQFVKFFENSVKSFRSLMLKLNDGKWNIFDWWKLTTYFIKVYTNIEKSHTFRDR